MKSRQPNSGFEKCRILKRRQMFDCRPLKLVRDLCRLLVSLQRLSNIALFFEGLSEPVPSSNVFLILFDSRS